MSYSPKYHSIVFFWIWRETVCCGLWMPKLYMFVLTDIWHLLCGKSDYYKFVIFDWSRLLKRLNRKTLFPWIVVTTLCQMVKTWENGNGLCDGVSFVKRCFFFLIVHTKISAVSIATRLRIGTNPWQIILFMKIRMFGVKLWVLQ